MSDVRFEHRIQHYNSLGWAIQRRKVYSDRPASDWVAYKYPGKLENAVNTLFDLEIDMTSYERDEIKEMITSAHDSILKRAQSVIMSQDKAAREIIAIAKKVCDELELNADTLQALIIAIDNYEKEIGAHDYDQTSA